MPVMIAEGAIFSISDTLSNMTTLVNAAWDVIVANPVLSICVGSCLIGVGFAIFSRAKAATS